MARSHLLVPEDILDLRGFVGALCDPEDAVSTHLSQLLPPGLVTDLQTSNEEGAVLPSTADRLLAELNKLIVAGPLYDAQAFEYARVSKRTAQLADAAPSGAGLVLLNRLLLTEAYPAYVELVYPRKSGDWYDWHIAKHAASLPDYDLYAKLLEHVIPAACRLLAPYALFTKRAKSVSSFAEKAVRKDYDNPICQTTDAVAARVIAETQAQVEDVCEYLKQAFLIDSANSVDHRERLKADQFGYLSIHYVVMPRKTQVDELEQKGIIPGQSWPALRGRKAEVQVRTMLQHAHATICHDRIYKSPFTPPESIQRDLARVAALLEQGDAAFGQAVERVSAYAGSYGAYHDRDKRDRDLKRLQEVLAREPDPAEKPKTALDLARIKKATWEWEAVKDILADLRQTPCMEQPRVWMEYGYALCRFNQKDPYSNGYEDGLGHLDKALKALEQTHGRGPKPLLIQSLSNLAWAYGNRDRRLDDIQRARDLYRRAYEMDRSNPYSLASYLEFEISLGVDREVLPYMRETLLEGVARCREHARIGVELPWAYLTMGRLYLLAGDPYGYDSLAAYCKAIHLCTHNRGKDPLPEEILRDELRFLTNIGKKAHKEADGWVVDLLELALCACYGAEDVWEHLRGGAILARDFVAPIVIVSGGTRRDVEAEMRSYEACLTAGFRDFSGTLISGGTTDGIPGIVGNIVAQLRSGGAEVHARCYLPSTLKSAPKDPDASPDERYDQQVRPVGDWFRPRQSLQTWVDLLAAGIVPVEVKLLGINGGPLTAFEYKLALALGAQVGVIRESGRAAEELAPDEDWQDASNLLWLPCDPMTIRAFVDMAVPADVPQETKEMGERIHSKFLQENWERSKDLIVRPWRYLPSDIQQDNIGQAIYAQKILERVGYTVRRAKGRARAYRFSPKEKELVEQMAEMEHGRWNVQRLRTGWRYGKERDEDRRISPYLRPWQELPNGIKRWDRKIVRRWPGLLAKSGLEVSRRRKGRS